MAEVVEVGSGLSVNRPGIREAFGLAHRQAMDKVIVTDALCIPHQVSIVLKLIEMEQAPSFCQFLIFSIY